MSNHNDSLQEGLGYTIHLFDGRRILYAVYHHCAASGQHYFAKGDKVYPIESVFRHSMQGVVVREDMPRWCSPAHTSAIGSRSLYLDHTVQSFYCRFPDDVLDSVGKDPQKEYGFRHFSGRPYRRYGDTRRRLR